MENENDIYGVGLKGVALWCFSVSMVNGVWTLSMCDEAVVMMHVIQGVAMNDERNTELAIT